MKEKILSLSFFIVLVLLLVFFLLQSVAFVTLWERHVLGLTQSRVGPFKLSLLGVAQPLVDGIKLLKKELTKNVSASFMGFFFCPFLAFLLFLMEWAVVPYYFSFASFGFSFLFFLVVVGLGVYPLMLAGVFSLSKFSILGAIRASSQTVSFEVLFSLLMMGLALSFFSFSFQVLSFSWYYFFFFPLLFWCVLVELNRAPFDFSEGESELVSGYNVEYGSAGFVLFFLKEYGSLLFFSVFISVLFFNSSNIFCFLIFTLVVYLRSSLPRFKYDLLMSFFWLKLLPLVINFLVFTVFFLY